jgi:hypothetical protein
MTLQEIPTKLPNRWVFLDADASQERVWTLLALPTDSHQLALTAKSTRRGATHTKTYIVVTVIAGIVVATGRAAIPRIVVPGTATQQLCCPPHNYFSRWGKSRSRKMR